MLDFIKRFAHVIAAVAIAYFGYSALEGGGKKRGDKQKLPRIPKSALPLRAADETYEIEGDPFYRDWAPYGPEYSPEAIAARKRAEQEAEEKAKRDAKLAREKERAELAKKQAKEREKAEENADSYKPFTLHLDSVLAMPGGGFARISGRTVRVGERLEGLDKREPPVLVGVRGVLAEVAYRGKRYVLDINHKRSVTIDRKPPKPKAEAEDVGAQG